MLGQRLRRWPNIKQQWVAAFCTLGGGGAFSTIIWSLSFMKHFDIAASKARQLETISWAGWVAPLNIYKQPGWSGGGSTNHAPEWGP